MYKGSDSNNDRRHSAADMFDGEARGAQLGRQLVARAGHYSEAAVRFLQCLLRAINSDPSCPDALLDFNRGVPGFGDEPPDTRVVCHACDGDDVCCQLCGGDGYLHREPHEYCTAGCRGLGELDDGSRCPGCRGAGILPLRQ